METSCDVGKGKGKGKVSAILIKYPLCIRPLHCQCSAMPRVQCKRKEGGREGGKEGRKLPSLVPTTAKLQCKMFKAVAGTALQTAPIEDEEEREREGGGESIERASGQ